jgi:hypothetical protein
MLERLAANIPAPKPLILSEFPRGTIIYYSYWCYNNRRGTIVGKEPKIVEGQTWLRIKFDHLKAPRRVPVTSKQMGSHISTRPFSYDESMRLQHYWFEEFES